MSSLPEVAEEEHIPEQGGEESSRRSRLRRQTVFYEPDHRTPKPSFRVVKGEGIQLRNIPSVSSQLARLKADEPLLVDLHKLLFKRSGTRTRRKRDIGDFSGFTFSEEDSTQEKQSLKERLSSVTNLKRIMDLFHLPQRNGKAKMIAEIVEFLMKPTDMSEKPQARVATPKKKAVKKVIVSKKRSKAETDDKEPPSKTAHVKKKAKTTPKKKKGKTRESKQSQDKKEEDTEMKTDDNTIENELEAQGSDPDQKKSDKKKHKERAEKKRKI